MHLWLFLTDYPPNALAFLTDYPPNALVFRTDYPPNALAFRTDYPPNALAFRRGGGGANVGWGPLGRPRPLPTIHYHPLWSPPSLWCRRSRLKFRWTLGKQILRLEWPMPRIMTLNNHLDARTENIRHHPAVRHR